MLKPSSGSFDINTSSVRTYSISLAIITTLFFIFGFVTNLNDILIPHLKRACQLSDFYSAFVQFAFFGAYFIISIPAGNILKKTGYKNGIVLGLLTCALGAFLFLPAANTRVYLLFLLALAVLASGITLLQVAANPYISILGPKEKAASRLSLSGAFNSLGATLAPYVGSLFILSGLNYSQEQIAAMAPEAQTSYLNSEAALVKGPYIVLGIILCLLAAFIFRSKLPDIKDEVEETKLSGKGSISQFRHLILGVVAIFCYVGAEVVTGSFLIRYGQSLSIAGFTEKIGAEYVSWYWFSAMVGRFVGIFVLPKIEATRALIFNCVVAILLLAVSILTNGTFSLWCLVLLGLCNSILWPVIFPLAITGLGPYTKRGSSLLIMGVVGGAIVPLIVGYLSDLEDVGIRFAFVVPVVCYAYIIYYGLWGYKPKATPQHTSLS